MEIKIKRKPYDKVKKIKKPKHKRPKKPSRFFNWLIRAISKRELKKVGFVYSYTNVPEKGPYLILMNHSSFIDLKIAATIFKGEPYNVVSTTDGLIGKKWLMRKLGCIPTQKFVHDPTLISDIKYCLKKKRSVLMFPEAGYSLDGTVTPIPNGLSRLVKILNVPVIFVKSSGAFSYDPLYNELQMRNVVVSAEVRQIISRKDILDKSNEELDSILKYYFTFDNFKWQQDHKIIIDEPFRADGLDRVLYKCPHCLKEGQTKGEGIYLTCKNCNTTYMLDAFGFLKAIKAETKFNHVPTWFKWQREEVKKEILNGTYLLDEEVDIGMIVDYKALYMVGKGRLKHDVNGFTLTSNDGKLNYKQSPLSSHTLNVDFYWYEIGDVISIGDRNALYYCFTKKGVPVAKARLAAEEIYKIKKAETMSEN